MLQRVSRRALLLFSAVLTICTHLPAFAQADAGEWTEINTTNSPTERHENAFAAVGDRLYLIGGRGVKKVQIFNPESRSWSDGASPPFQMHHFQAVVVGTRIYVVGAYTGTCCDSEYGVDHVYYYETTNNTWNQSHEVPANRRRGSAAAVYYNDKIYLVGGIEGGHGAPATGYTWFDEYDPVTGQWKVLPDAPRKRDHFHAVVYNNKLYLIGGRDTSVPAFTSANVAVVDIYNFTTGTWSTLSASHNLPTTRGGTTSVLYRGEILVIGGESSKQTLAHAQTEAFDPISESWRTLDPLNVGRHGTQAIVYNDAVYIAAGSAQQGGSPELDSIERFATEGNPLTAFDAVLQPGWNLVGLPLVPVDNNYEAVYADISVAADQAPMTWASTTGAYVEEAELGIGKGYWVHLDETSAPAQTQTILGEPINAMQMSLKTGWNMISGPSCSDVILRGASTDPIASVPTSSIYTWEEAYVPAYSTTFPRGLLQQGVGYWVYATKNATLSFDCGASKALPAEPAPADDRLASFHRIEVSDAAGHRRDLFFNGRLETEDELASFLLPPRPHRGGFDVRIGADRRLVESSQPLIQVQSDTWPLTLQFAAPVEQPGARYVVEMRSAGVPVDRLVLSAGQPVVLANPAITGLSVTLESSMDALPANLLTVQGGYPNPFSDATTLRYELTREARVRIEVYDALGRRVHDEARVEAAGPTETRLESAGWPAGLYLYRVTAEEAGRLTTSSGRLILSR